jgi:pimeloyl-[acyl-carrier protein] methyl ester esterase
VFNRVLLLPGLDGTGKLLDRFVALTPAGLSCEVIAYQDNFASLDEYVNVVKARLGAGAPTVLVAESFSGPIAAQIASRCRDQIAGVVFAASFVKPPHAALLNLAEISPTLLFNLMRETLVNHFCANGVHDKVVLDEAKAVVGALASEVIKRRLMLLGSLAKLRLAPIDIPVLSLRATRDRLITKTATSSIANTFPKTLSIDVDSPHFLLQTRPEQCWRHIEKFAFNYYA